MDDLFERCCELAQKLYSGDEEGFRNALILLINDLSRDGVSYPPIVNHLIRISGLYPYIDEETASFDDLLVKDLFVVDVGGGESRTLHRDQSFLLKQLISGENLVVSAPTSFGKSFVIDALISIKRPPNVMIIVPTLALADETRRRLSHKFAKSYRIITTSDVELAQNNLFIFPQERAANYFLKIKNLDLLIIDEFYKASVDFEEGRSLSLVRLITQLRHKSKQCYFLAPNIDEVIDNPFTKGMRVCDFKLRTVFLNYYDEYKTLPKGVDAKVARLKSILVKTRGQKNLIYTRSPNEINRLLDLIAPGMSFVGDESLLNAFADWFSINYTPNGCIPVAARHGIVLHHGRLHRAVAQIVVRLFESCASCNILIATSSLIEGVNTSAENVILWNNKNGTSKFNAFTYKNIAGRAGRMFRHFVGNVYNLEPPPDLNTQAFLDIKIPDEDLHIFSDDQSGQYLTEDQIKAINSKSKSIAEKYGWPFYKTVFHDNTLNYLSAELLDSAVRTLEMCRKFNLLQPLMRDDVSRWRAPLEAMIGLLHDKFRSRDERRQIVELILVLPSMWSRSMRSFLDELSLKGISIDKYFQLERDIAFSFASLVQDYDLIYKAMFHDESTLGTFAKKLSTVFLPTRVYELEEYGLPRMISRKIQNAGLIDLESDEPLEAILEKFRSIGFLNLKEWLPALHEFDLFILEYFYDGISK